MSNTPSPSREPPQPPVSLQHNILISIPRTASNLVTHLLTLPSQPSIVAHPRDGYFFLPALSGRLKHSTFTHAYTSWSPEQKQDIDSALRKGFEAWEKWVDDAERAGKGTYVKEHVNWTLLPAIESDTIHAPSASRPIADDNEHPANPTAIPDAFWQRVRATLLIRHPALTFASALRTALDNEGEAQVLNAESEKMMQWECTFRWHVLLYRFLVAERARGVHVKEPIIIDASQLQATSFVRKYAHAVGLDPGKVQTQWSAVSADEQQKLGSVERRMKDTLLSSTDVVQGKLVVGAIDIGEEKVKWEAEFGGLLAERLERLVRAAMGDYEWLYERKWTE